MNILNTLEIQLFEIEKLLRADLKNGSMIYNYLVCTSEVNFLDSLALRKYLTETKIENTLLLKLICESCINIIEIWNNDLENLPINEFKEPFVYANENTGSSINTTWNFHAIYLKKDKVSIYNTLHGKETFVKEYHYKIEPIPLIASKCNNILNFITASYPEINVDFNPKYYLTHYQKTKRFDFQSEIKPFSKIEFKEVKNRLEKYLLRYQYIFEIIESENKIEFKQDVLDHLKNICDKQIHSKYKTLLNDAIRLIENNFNATRAINKTTSKITKNIKSSLQDFFFFQVFFKTKQGNEKNNDSIITPDNWIDYKDVFFNQRMSKYKESYTENEKIKLELEDLNKLTINTPDYKVLKQRYEDYLNAVLNSELPQQTETNILIKLEKEIKTISKQMSIFKSIESKEINVCVISKTEIFDINLLDNYLLNQTKNHYLDARLTDLKNLCEAVKKSNENKINASNKETFYKYDFERTSKKSNKPECYKFSSFNEAIFLLNSVELKYKRIEFNEAEKHYKNGYFAKCFSKISLALKCNEVLEVLNKYLTQETETTKGTKKPDELYKTQNLFKVGLLFAKGEMNKYFKINAQHKTVMKSGFSAPKIAKELGNESYNKWILASINDYTPDNSNGNKNIFNSLEMMTKIISHCEAEKIIVDAYFKSRLPTE